MMEDIEIALHPVQLAFFSSTSTYRGYVGGRGSGKSFVGAVDLLCRASTRRGLYGIYAPTYPLLRDATLRTFMDVAGPYIGQYNKAEGVIYLSGGSEIITRSLDDPEKARGPNMSGAWLDEASLVVRDAYDIIIAALRQDGVQGWLTATFTPKGRNHWTYQVFGNNSPDTAIFHSATSDNPFLPPGFRDTLARQYTTAFAAQELEGRFVDLSGETIRRDWLRVVDAAPASSRLVRAWDFAATESSRADWTVGAKMCVADGVYYILHMVRDRVGPGEIERIVRQTATADGRACPIIIEQEPGSSGKISASYLIKALAGYNIRAEPATGSKLVRAQPWIAQAEAGNVRLVNGPWIQAFIDEAVTFPPAKTDTGMHDDQVDAVSAAFNHLTRSGPIMLLE